MRKVTFSFPFVIAVSLIIQGLGLTRSLVLAKDFGADSTLDAFYLANVFTVSIFNVVGSSITTIVIPELNREDSFDNKRKYIEGYLTIVRSISLIVSVILFFGLFFFRNTVAPNFSDKYFWLFIAVTGVLLVSQQFRFQASFSVSLLQNDGHYIIPRVLDILPVFLPVVYLLFTPHTNIIYLASIMAIAYVLETIMFNFIQRRINDEYIFRIRVNYNENIKKMLINTIPILCSSMIFQLQILLSNYFAGNFGHGYITLLSNTNQVMGIFQALFIMNLINMVYPLVVRNIKKNKIFGIKKIGHYVTATNVIVILLIWGYIAVGKDLISLLFVRGAFTEQNAVVVYRFGIILGIVLPFDVLRDYCYRAYYALNNTKKPMLNSITTVIVNIIMLIFLAKLIGVYSIVVAPAFGTVFSTISIVARLWKDKLKIDLRVLLVGYSVINLIGICMFVFIKYVDYSSPILTVRLVVNIFIGCVVAIILLTPLFLFMKKKGLINEFFK